MYGHMNVRFFLSLVTPAFTDWIIEIILFVSIINTDSVNIIISYHKNHIFLYKFLHFSTPKCNDNDDPRDTKHAAFYREKHCFHNKREV